MRRFFLCAKGLWAEGRRSRASLNHGGQAPIPPLLNNRIVRDESMCEEQGLCEHVFSGKMIAGVVCGADRVHNPAIRVGHALRRRCCAQYMELVCAAGRE